MRALLRYLDRVLLLAPTVYNATQWVQAAGGAGPRGAGGGWEAIGTAGGTDFREVSSANCVLRYFFRGGWLDALASP
jgi:hypothetical protein